MCFLKQYKSASYITFINLFTRLCCFVLVLQVCEERLQFSLSENVKTNVLWGSTVKDTVMLRPWGEQITENSTEEVTVKEQKRINKEQQEDERYEEEDLQKKLWLQGVQKYLAIQIILVLFSQLLRYMFAFTPIQGG